MSFGQTASLWHSTSVQTNPSPASALDAGRRSGRTAYAPSSRSAVVAERGRSVGDGRPYATTR